MKGPIAGALRVVTTTLLAFVSLVSILLWWNETTNALLAAPVFAACVVISIALNWRVIVQMFVMSNVESVASEKNPEAVKALVLRLRRTAHHKRIESSMALLFVLVAMLGGALLFTHEQLTFYPDKTLLGSLESGVKTAEADVVAAERRLNSDKDTLNRLLKQEPSGKEALETAQTSIDGDGGLVDSYRGILAGAQNSLNEEKTRIASEEVRWFIAAVTWRVGIGIFTFFLVQILIGLYRYASRLEAFYESRADAFSLSSLTGQESVKDIATLLSPDNIDFGKTPSTPLQDLIAAVRKLPTSAEASKSASQ
jgi:hypothetical protein